MSGISVSDELERIRDANPIEDVVPEYVDLVRRGNVFKGLCPFHPDQNPSMDVNPQRQTYRCWSCGEHGDVFSFIQKIEGIEFPDAKQKLADRVGIEITAYRPDKDRREENSKDHDLLDRAARWFERQLWSESGSGAREYLFSRGFTEETIRAFRIGYAPAGWSHLDDDLARLGGESHELRQRACRLGLLKEKEAGRYYDAFRDRVMFPILEHKRGRVVAFGGRDLASVSVVGGESPPKYINSPESTVFHKKQVLFGRREGRLAISRSRRVILCEGYTDVIMAHQSGFEMAVASLGTAFTAEHVAELSKIVNSVDLIFDGDAPGQMAARKACERFLGTRLEVRVVILEDGVDPCDLLSSGDGAQEFERVLESGVDPIEFIVKQIQKEHPGSGASSAQQVMEAVSSVVLSPYEGIALERAATMVARLTGHGEHMILREHQRIRDQHPARGSVSRLTRLAEENEVVGNLPDDEEAILVTLIRDPKQMDLLFQLRPHVRWSQPVHRALARRIEQLGEIPDPVHIGEEAEKSLLLDLKERVDREDQVTVVEDRPELRFQLTIDLVIDRLRGLIVPDGQGKRSPSDIIGINKTIQRMREEPDSFHNLSELGQIINKFVGERK